MGVLKKAAVGAIAALGAYVVNKVVADDASGKAADKSSTKKRPTNMNQPVKKTVAKAKKTVAKARKPVTKAKQALAKARRPVAKARATAKRTTAKPRKAARSRRAAKR